MIYRIENAGEKAEKRMVQLTVGGQHFNLAPGEFFVADLNPTEAERLGQALPILKVVRSDEEAGSGSKGLPIENPKPAVDPGPGPLHTPILIDGQRHRSQVPFPRVMTAPDNANEPTLENPGEAEIDLTEKVQTIPLTNVPKPPDVRAAELVPDQPAPGGSTNLSDLPPGTKVGVHEHGRYHQEMTPAALDESPEEREAREKREEEARRTGKPLPPGKDETEAQKAQREYFNEALSRTHVQPAANETAAQKRDREAAEAARASAPRTPTPHA